MTTAATPSVADILDRQRAAFRRDGIPDVPTRIDRVNRLQGAAGNRVMMRPSEVTAHTAQLLADVAPQYFPVEELAVITDAQATAAAGVHLVPVTLNSAARIPSSSTTAPI